jgi:hypothetical protein
MGFPCNCITVTYIIGASVDSIDLSAIGTYNGRNYYEFIDGPDTYTIFWNGVSDWNVTTDGLGGSVIIAFLEENVDCPDIDDWKFSVPVVRFQVTARDCCAPKQERVEELFRSVKLPEVFEEQNRGFFRCCCPFNVLASDGPTWENDITSAWIKLSSLSDTTSAVLLKHGQPTAYTPTIQSFPNDANAYYWTINWNDVLLSDGVGCYSLQINYNISGVSGDFTWGIYNLLPFTIQNALKTARLRVKFNSYQEIEGINFTGANVEDTIRFHGFIGFRQPNMEIDNLIYKNREVKKVKRENLNTYEVITDPTCEEHIKKLTDLYLLSENELFISDYNAHNHSYRYQDLPAVVEESPEITYFDFARSALLKCIVGDKKKDKRSFYNGGLNLLSGPTGGQVCAPASYVVEYATAGPIQSGTIPSGGSETIVVPDPAVGPDTDLEVNGTPEGTFAAGSTIEVNITDGVNPVTPNDVTVVGDVVTIEVPAATAAPVGATLMKTGQTTSYRTGDDGDLEAGRATDFFTLASNNPFGNTNRFTDELGGSTYTNNWVIDWSTFDGATVLGYYRVENGVGINWNAAIDAALGTFGTFSGCRLPNFNEIFNIANFSLSGGLYSYSPLNLSATIYLWTSTTNPGLITFAYAAPASTSNLDFAVGQKTGNTTNGQSLRYIPVRTFTVTGTTLT